MKNLLAALLLFPAAIYAEERKSYVVPLIGLDGRVYKLTVTPHEGETRQPLICFETPKGDLSCIVSDNGMADRATLSGGKEPPPT